MQTHFSSVQLEDSRLAEIEKNLRKCVHCGFCQATCPTYTLLGDELDSPRGRIYLIQDMLENERQPNALTVAPIDRCLSCLSCMSTCPSGVNYRHLIDHARAYIERRYKRPLRERILRWMLRQTLPYRRRFQLALMLARPFSAFAPMLRPLPLGKEIGAMLTLARSKPLPKVEPVIKPEPLRHKVALFEGCVQPVMRPDINLSAKSLLGYFGVETVLIAGEGCCGSLPYHLGYTREAEIMALRNLKLWNQAIETEGVEALVVTASGCGSTINDYATMLADHPEAQPILSRLEGKVFDPSQYLTQLELPEKPDNGLRVAYHAACSLQHGLKVKTEPKTLLKRAGFTVLEPKNAHLCCGSAGVYNILHVEIANKLGEMKVAALSELAPDVIVSGNIGCLTQLAKDTSIPVLPFVTLLAWAYGAPKPLESLPELI